MTSLPLLGPEIHARLSAGMVIPAHPLALTGERKLDEKRQRALTRYYCAAGAGGLAVGVHTTQFEIRDSDVGLYEPVLTLAAETVAEHSQASGSGVVMIAGIAGQTQQAVREARLASDVGYHLAMVSLGALQDASVDELIGHLREIAAVMPIMGFYLQPAVGGRILGYDFWRRAVEIDNLVAIKIAPFNRYATIEVVRAVLDAGRTEKIALYTGNDDNIVFDLLSEFRVGSRTKESISIVGGLLGHWAVWTKRAVELLEQIHAVKSDGSPIPPALLTLAHQITDANAAIFDPQHHFAGCIPGIHEVLRRQGLLAGRWTLNPAEELSPGQLQEIDRVYANYPHLNDDAFVREHLEEWLK